MKAFLGRTGCLLALLAAASNSAADERDPTPEEAVMIRYAIDIIELSCIGDDAAQRLRTMLEEKRIKVDPDNDEYSTATADRIILQKSAVSGIPFNPLDFGDPKWVSTGWVLRVIQLATTMVHEETHTHQGWMTRHFAGIAGAEPPAYHKGLMFMARLLQCLEPELQRELEPITRITRDCWALENGNPQGGDLTREEKIARLRRIIRLSREEFEPHTEVPVPDGLRHNLWKEKRPARRLSDPEYYRELSNKIAFMQTAAEWMRDYIDVANEKGCGYPTEQADKKLAWLKDRARYVKDLSARDPKNSDLRRILPCAEEKAARALYYVSGADKASAVNIDRVFYQNMPTSAGGGSMVYGKAGSALPKATVEVTFKNGKTVSVQADEAGRFVVEPKDVPGDFSSRDDIVKIEQKPADAVPFDDKELEKLLKDICTCHCATKTPEEGDGEKQAMRAGGAGVAVTGNNDTRRLFEFRVTNRGTAPYKFVIPRGTLVVVQGGQEGILMEEIRDEIPSGETRTYRPWTACYRIGVAPKTGPLGEDEVSTLDTGLGQRTYTPEELEKRLRETGFALLPPRPAVVDFLENVDGMEKSGVFADSPMGREDCYQWSVWIFQGAGKEQFEQIVGPQIEQSEAYRKADEEGKQRLRRKYLDVPFEKVQRAAEGNEEEIRIEYTDAQAKAAAKPPSAVVETVRPDAKLVERED